MSRDGIWFVALILFLAWVGGQLAVTISSIVVIVLVWLLLMMIVTHFSKPKGKIPNGKVWNGSFGMSPMMIPKPFEKLEQEIASSLRAPQDDHDLVVLKFLRLINADVQPPLPNCMYDAIAKKVLYEYHRKYSTLLYPVDNTQSVDIKDVIRPLSIDEQKDFYQFCVANN